MRLPAWLILLFAVSPAFALAPNELILIVNKNEPDSAALASHYAKVRGVPAENIVTLDLPKDESMNRGDYDTKLVGPLRAALKDRKDKVRCLMCMYGVPLRVGN